MKGNGLARANHSRYLQIARSAGNIASLPLEEERTTPKRTAEKTKTADSFGCGDASRREFETGPNSEEGGKTRIQTMIQILVGGLRILIRKLDNYKVLDSDIQMNKEGEMKDGPYRSYATAAPLNISGSA